MIINKVNREPGSSSCPACCGRHRPHTCGRQMVRVGAPQTKTSVVLPKGAAAIRDPGMRSWFETLKKSKNLSFHTYQSRSQTQMLAVSW